MPRACRSKGDDANSGSCCSPLGFVKNVRTGVSYWWKPEHHGAGRRHHASPTASPNDKKYVHVPTHAASSHLRTTSTATMQEANEAL
jgi:hypothetical protein